MLTPMHTTTAPTLPQGLKLLLTVLAGALLMLGLTGIAPLAAQQVQDPKQAVRVQLLDGGWLEQGGQRQRLAGIMLELADGWKTYWRVPGEGGLPPRFDFTGSANVAEARVLWPAPTRYADPVTGEVIGYKGRVVFPLLVTPEDPASPVRLRVKMDYGICGEMCVPMQGAWQIDLPPQPPADTAAANLLRAWLARTPQATADASWRVLTARYVSHSGPLLEVVVSGPADERIADAFVEGVDLAVFGKPQIRQGKGGSRILRIPVRGLADKNNFKASQLRLTLVLNGEKAVERKVRLP